MSRVKRKKREKNGTELELRSGFRFNRTQLKQRFSPFWGRRRRRYRTRFRQSVRAATATGETLVGQRKEQRASPTDQTRTATRTTSSPGGLFGIDRKAELQLWSRNDDLRSQLSAAKPEFDGLDRHCDCSGIANMTELKFPLRSARFHGRSIGRGAPFWARPDRPHNVSRSRPPLRPQSQYNRE